MTTWSSAWRNAPASCNCKSPNAKRAEQALWESEQLYSQIALNASDVLYVLNMESGHVDWYGEIDKALSYAEGEFPRTMEAWETNLHSDDRVRVLEASSHSCRSGVPFNEEYRFRRRDGSFIYWSDRGRPIYDMKGNVGKFIGACTDITRRKQAEKESAAGQGGSGGRQSGQERVPGQHEPRNPHAHERHHRHDRAWRSTPT